MIDLSQDSFGQLYSLPQNEPQMTPFSQVLQQATMPNTRASSGRTNDVSSLINQFMTDVNRPETAESPWVGALDPFGDV